MLRLLFHCTRVIFGLICLCHLGNERIDESGKLREFEKRVHKLITFRMAIFLNPSVTVAKSIKSMR